MNSYICFWKNEKLELYAKTTYGAQRDATVLFQKNTKKKVKPADITVVLSDLDGKNVTHSPAML